MFVIVNVGSDALHNSYATERGAKGACTRLNKQYGDVGQWKVVTRDEYLARPVEMVERTNLMTGKKFMEPKNTPVYMSPAFESYWSA